MSSEDFQILAEDIVDFLNGIEASYYPISEGYIGKAMLLNAINELACGVPFEKVLERYGLKRKGKQLKIIDKRNVAVSTVAKSLEKVVDFL